MREYCFKHQLLRAAGEQCVQCAIEQSGGAPPQRDTLNMLEARISDHDGDMVELHRRMNELRHIVLDLQRAQNALAKHIGVVDIRQDSIEHLLLAHDSKIDQLAAHARPNEDLLP